MNSVQHNLLWASIFATYIISEQSIQFLPVPSNPKHSQLDMNSVLLQSVLGREYRVRKSCVWIDKYLRLKHT